MARKTELVPIDKGVPIPERVYTYAGRERQYRYQWRTMEVGDSFLAQISPTCPLAGIASRRFAPKRFTQRLVDGGTRVWRVE